MSPCCQGDEVVNFLQGDYLPTHQLSPDQSREFCDALRTDTKLFRNYFKVSSDVFQNVLNTSVQGGHISNHCRICVTVMSVCQCNWALLGLSKYMSYQGLAWKFVT